MTRMWAGWAGMGGNRDGRGRSALSLVSHNLHTMSYMPSLPPCVVSHEMSRAKRYPRADICRWRCGGGGMVAVVCWRCGSGGCQAGKGGEGKSVEPGGADGGGGEGGPRAVAVCSAVVAVGAAWMCLR